MGDYAKVTFSYITKNGKPATKDLQIKKGTNFALYNKKGEYENTYNINDKGQIVPQSKDEGMHKTLQKIETTEAEVNRLFRISKNDGNAGLTQQDFTIENTKRQKQEMRAIMNSGVPKTKPSLYEKITDFISQFFK